MSVIHFLRNLIKIARISSISNDDGKYPIQQINYMGKTTPCLIVMPYGTHANIPIDSLATILNVNGDESNIHAIPHIPEERIKNLKSGEVIFYHPKTKSFIHFKNSGDIDIESISNINIDLPGDININCNNLNLQGNSVNLNANLNVVGNTNFTGTVTANGFIIDERHTHTGSPSAPPGAVSNTGTVT